MMETKHSLEQEEKYNFCIYCGTKVNADYDYCAGCGKSVKKIKPMEGEKRDEIKGGIREEFKGTPNDDVKEKIKEKVNFYSNLAQINSDQNENYSMKWYKFLIYVQLILSPIVYVVIGIRYIFGKPYGDSTTWVYLFYDSIRVVDIMYGVGCFIFAVCAIVARQKLAKFKKDGPSWYYIAAVFNVAVLAVYVIAVYSIMKSTSSISSSLILLVVSVIMYVLTYVYLEKRKSLFIN